jgi:hypothetical protein
MSGMTPQEFYESFVIGNYWDWKNATPDVRLAFNLAVAAFHLADHYFRYFEKENPDLVRRYGRGDDGLKMFQAKVIQDMATAYKHLYTRAHCEIASGGAIHRIEFEGGENRS